MGREILSSPSSAAPVVLPDNDAKHPAHSAKLVKAAVGDHETDFLVQAFDDRVFICVSQMDKLGTMISGEVEKTVGGTSSYSVTVLMGKRDEMMMELCARRVLAQMDEGGCEKKLLMSMALKNHSMQHVDAIVNTIMENKVW